MHECIIATGSVTLSEKLLPEGLEHPVAACILEAAIADFEAAGTTFSTGIINDDRIRRQYVKHIREISDQVRTLVAKGDMSVMDGAEYCSQLRDKIFAEYRRYTSAFGVAKAEQLKLNAKGLDYYLNKYSTQEFQKKFVNLDSVERSQIYYKILEKAGSGDAAVTTKLRRLQIQAKVALIFSAILAAGEIVAADDKIKEASRQGSTIAAGLLGGAAAGALAGTVCGPAEPICAVGVVFIGSSLGALLGNKIDAIYQEELPVFLHWLNDE